MIARFSMAAIRCAALLTAGLAVATASSAAEPARRNEAAVISTSTARADPEAVRRIMVRREQILALM